MNSVYLNIESITIKITVLSSAFIQIYIYGLEEKRFFVFEKKLNSFKCIKSIPSMDVIHVLIKNEIFIFKEEDLYLTNSILLRLM